MAKQDILVEKFKEVIDLRKNYKITHDKAAESCAEICQIEMEEFALKFGTWYSGMEEEKVKRAIEKFKREKQESGK